MVSDVNKSRLKSRPILAECVATSIIVLLLTMLLYKLKGVAPFGNLSLAWGDAYLQYLDFLCYLKDVLAGKNSILYTFSNGLGKTGIGLYAYYLASPVNLIVLLFDKGQMSICLNWIIAIKMAIAAGSMAFFLRERFSGKLNFLIQTLLCCSYSWMQYFWAQGSNIMWLDGICLLPFMLLGVHRLIKGKPIFLSVIVGLSIIIQWYTAGINCLFSVFWFIMELVLYSSEQPTGGKEWLRVCVSYLAHMIIGIGISAVLFLPTIIDLRAGKGDFDWDIFQNTFNGNIISVLPGYVLGGTSSKSQVSLFCGSLTLIGVLLLFREKSISEKTKAALVGMLAFSLLIYYWQPFYGAFSLLKSASSYWFRYSYISCLALIFFAAYCFAKSESSADAKLLQTILFWSAALLLIDYVKPSSNSQLVYWTVVMAVAIGIALKLYLTQNGLKKHTWGGILFVLVVSELLWNGSMLIDICNKGDRTANDNYQSALGTQIDVIKEMDGSTYRISQTSNKQKNHKRTNITATYDNALACSFAGIASYSSCPDAAMLDFLNKAGYRTEGKCISVVNTSILPVDSLFGVKYLLSPYPISGYQEMMQPDETTEMAVYENPYAFPIAFLVNYDGELFREYTNPFEYMNDYLSALYGERRDVFIPVASTKEAAEKEIRYRFEGLAEGMVLYGNIPWNSVSKVNINVNDIYTQGYAQWLSPSVFYIPVTGAEAKLICSVDNTDILQEGQFYRVDLDVLDEISTAFKRSNVMIDIFENGHIEANVIAEESRELFFSVPYDSGWSITVNGASVVPASGEAMIRIPLQKGKNLVEMRYHINGLPLGIMISLISLLILLGEYVIDRKKSEK